MGYTTDFDGQFMIEPPLEEHDRQFLQRFSEVRHVKLKCDESAHGPEGRWASKKTDGCEVIDDNSPPAGVPGLWCQWIPSDDGRYLYWDGGEKFYEYTAWIIFLIDEYLTQRGYIINGEVHWSGEDRHDLGIIKVVDNKVTEHQAQITYKEV